ncbi:protein adenylyltransferase [Marchantia polymorpha subsp. ruderalis]|uniref:Selenoprotein O n=2 Tax=Marchantia polymorpha TaxID=3197 RepID=A0A176VSA8_MARPO|nr:hypothetical protein AXG93_4776s1120 [Marchantia polymorpha subsp. ruderalis]PTQ36463.1 hypothetical protein MARPO_0063s0012 [Marchantia polymorpha]BBN19249.1 hypothetical protein Mp_8g09070 [Marchantia polymorpha subsp. ruderalis]|eukprot:PTQ36463.1 hypothetical protein MARPO_0063s0012 [Marchantia polymorpha]
MACPSFLLRAAASLPPSLAKTSLLPSRAPRSDRKLSFATFHPSRRCENRPKRSPIASKLQILVRTSSSSVPGSMAEDLKALKLADATGLEENGSSSKESAAAGVGQSRSDVVQKSEVNGGSSSSSSKKRTLEELRWDHSFVNELPGDPRTGGPVRQVLHSCYTKVTPSAAVDDPQLVAWSEPVSQILDLDPKEFERPDFAQFFSGATLLKDSLPYAQCYGGHQFGVWAGQLGDGRAITLGEVLNEKGERWELQLKGAGKTPYSRSADGLAVLRSSVREFLCSEAMHHLGIPTTRALCLVTTGASVERDMFYDGHPKLEPGAVVCRVSPSFLRFGSYQIHAARAEEDLQIVRQVADYTIRHHYPQFVDLPFERQVFDESTEAGPSDTPLEVDITKNKYASWFTEVAERTAIMIAKWQGVGFTHGVMNTDNMSILGLTIDYGPFGFLDAFDPKFTPNTTDLPGRRYCFANQPDIGLWNSMQLANTLHSAGLISTDEAQYGLGRYADKFMEEYRQHMSHKMGLKEYNKELLTKLLNNLAVDKVDYTNFFRALGNVSSASDIADDNIWLPLKPALLDLSKERKKVWVEWLREYTRQLAGQGIPDEERKVAMNKVNPKYILRNYLCQTAIDQAEQGDYSETYRLLKVMQRPYDDQPGMEIYARLPPAWAYRPGVCMLSCSS